MKRDENAFTRLRRGVESDADGMARVHFRAVRGIAAEVYPPQTLARWARPVDGARVDEFRRAIAGGDERFFVAERAGEVVAFGSIVVSVNELRSLYVHPDSGRRGIGSALLCQLENEAIRRGMAGLELTASLNAERFYLQHGYAIAGRGVHQSSSGFSLACVNMRKDLPATSHEEDGER